MNVLQASISRSFHLHYIVIFRSVGSICNTSVKLGSEINLYLQQIILVQVAGRRRGEAACESCGRRRRGVATCESRERRRRGLVERAASIRREMRSVYLEPRRQT